MENEETLSSILKRQDPEKFEKFVISEKLKHNFKTLESITDKWGYFRQVYFENIPYILETSKNDIQQWYESYFFDWGTFFSPIEKTAWNSIRSLGGVVLYPQFPLFNYFIDFANPYLRIGLELDGKDYHNNEKDKERDKLLADYNWLIFRVTGGETYKDYKDIMDIGAEQIEGEEKEKELENWILNTCDGVIFSIKAIFFMSKEEKNHYSNIPLYNDSREITFNLLRCCKMSLKKHSLINLKI